VLSFFLNVTASGAFADAPTRLSFRIMPFTEDVYSLSVVFDFFAKRTHTLSDLCTVIALLIKPIAPTVNAYFAGCLFKEIKKTHSLAPGSVIHGLGGKDIIPVLRVLALLPFGLNVL
jgi:hypothetical protein